MRSKCEVHININLSGILFYLQPRNLGSRMSWTPGRNQKKRGGLGYPGCSWCSSSIQNLDDRAEGSLERKIHLMKWSVSHHILEKTFFFSRICSKVLDNNYFCNQLTNLNWKPKVFCSFNILLTTIISLLKRQQVP